MLQRKPGQGADVKLRTFGFLLSAEIEQGETTPEQVAVRLADALTFVEGVGNVQCELLGEIDVLDGDA